MILAPLKHGGRLFARVSEVCDQNALLDQGWPRPVTYKPWKSAAGGREMPPVLGGLVHVQSLPSPAEQHGVLQ